MRFEMPGRDSRRQFAAPAVALMLLGMLASCGDITTTPVDVNKQNVVYGMVTSKGVALQGVQVSGGAETVATDAAGSYKTYVPAGNVTLVFSKSGYSDVSMPVSAESRSEIQLDVTMTPGTSTGGGAGFTVTPGAYQRVKVSAPGKVSFTVVGIDMDLDKDAWPIVYFYDDKGYTGGKGGSGGFNGELRTYKLKFYDANGVIASESYYVEPKGNTPRWDPKVARNVTLEWGPDFVQSTVDGIPFRKNASVPRSFTVGIGYPPSVRPGWDGAVYTNIVWPAGATKVN